MDTLAKKVPILTPETRRFYQDCLRALLDEGVDFLVGGAYAFAEFTGIVRHTKDLDLFMRPRDFEATLAVLERRGYRVEQTYPHWLGKAFCLDAFVDLIYRSGNGLAEVDDGWFEHAKEGVVLDQKVKLCPVEETILSKSFIMERERYDGADVIHYIYACANAMDWDRLITRFGEHWRVLLSHLILFGFVYPDQRGRIPNDVLTTLIERLQDEMHDTENHKLCFGPLLSQVHYLVDTTQGGYQDARFRPSGSLGERDMSDWRNRIDIKALAKTQGISLEESKLKVPRQDA
jgi:hypothetical protein